NLRERAVATMRRALPRLPLQTRHPARCQDPKKVSSPLLPCPLKRFAPQPVRWFPLDRNSCALADRIRHPAQFSKLIVQLGLELVAGLGSRVSPEELDDEVTDLGDHWNQANGQRQQGGGEVRCQEERGTRSIIHRASFPGKRQVESVPDISRESRLFFNRPE